MWILDRATELRDAMLGVYELRCSFIWFGSVVVGV